MVDNFLVRQEKSELRSDLLIYNYYVLKTLGMGGVYYENKA